MTQQYSTQTHRPDTLVVDSRQFNTRHEDFHIFGIIQYSSIYVIFFCKVLAEN